METTDSWDELDWWDDRIYEYDNRTLTRMVVTKKRDREFTMVTKKDLIDGQYDHVIVLGKF
jgi:hypothetical protein